MVNNIIDGAIVNNSNDSLHEEICSDPTSVWEIWTKLLISIIIFYLI